MFTKNLSTKKILPSNLGININMTKLALILGLVFWACFIPIKSLAQEHEVETPIVNLPILVDCGKKDSIAEITDRYEEIPFMEGIVAWRIPNGQMLEGPMHFYYNPKSGSFSIVVTPTNGDDVACIFVMGRSLKPYVSRNET